MKYNRIFVLGSLAFDQISNLPGRFSDWILPDKLHQLNVSFTVASMRREFGGTGGNCAYSLGLLGMKPTLLGYVGKDGLEYREYLNRAGVDTAHVFVDEELLTATGYVMTDKDDNQIWSFYPGPLKKASGLRLKAHGLKQDDFVALLPSEPGVFVQHLHELITLKTHFLFDPAFFIPNLSPENLRLGLDHAAIVIGNDYEIALMEQKSQRKLEALVKNGTIVVKTLGAQGSHIFADGTQWQIQAEPVKKVVDPTGAGDAYRAGFLSEYIKGSDLETCGKMGSKIAALAVSTYGTQTHTITLKEIYDQT
jgi:adenosine kinase